MNIPHQIVISTSSGEPLVEQLQRQFTWQIASGQIRPGETLPSIRGLAGQLSINMHTIRSAYRRLERDGLVRTRQGFGTQVLEIDPQRLAELAGRRRTYTIGVILPGMASLFYHAFLQGVEQVIAQEQMMLFVCNAHEDPQAYLRYFAQLSARNVDGIIVAAFDLHPSLGQASSAALPIVHVDWPGCRGPSVNLDLEEAGFQAVRHLLSHGHRRIGQIGFAGRGANVLAVEAGAQRALREAGIEADGSLIVRVPGYGMQAGELGAQQLLKLSRPPTAIFAIADMLALGAMRALRKEGLRIPEQMALASLDDIPLAELLTPGLTTVALPARQLGTQAMRMLKELVEGREPAVQQVLLPAELVIRQSCGCV